MQACLILAFAVLVVFHPYDKSCTLLSGVRQNKTVSLNELKSKGKLKNVSNHFILYSVSCDTFNKLKMTLYSLLVK